MTTSVDAPDAAIAESALAGSILAASVKGRPAPVRRTFIARYLDREALPPLARIMRGGRGSDVRLKVYLSLLWSGVAPPHDVTRPARAWALLLGLKDPEKNGARQVRSAIGWLAKNDFIRREEQPGAPTTLYLLRESGDGKAYTLPHASLHSARRGPDARNHHYIRVPAELWTGGWLAELSAAGLAMFLVLLEAKRTQDDTEEIWFSPSVADARYALSEGTRSAGLRELARLGLVNVRRRRVETRPLDVRRRRNTYTLNMGALSRVLPTVGSTEQEDELAVF